MRIPHLIPILRFFSGCLSSSSLCPVPVKFLTLSIDPTGACWQINVPRKNFSSLKYTVCTCKYLLNICIGGQNSVKRWGQISLGSSPSISSQPPHWSFVENVRKGCESFMKDSRGTDRFAWVVREKNGCHRGPRIEDAGLRILCGDGKEGDFRS